MAEKILIVDDDHDTLEVMKMFLTRLGYQALTAATGLEALALAHKELPDLVVLDVMMPGMDGFEVASNLHRTPDTATIPILMVTARSSDADKERGYGSGVDIYLTKPLHRMDFQANIKTLLMQRRAKRMMINEAGAMVGVMAAKGGLGTSTLALNLATSYARKYGVKVIAAELRPGSGTWADEMNLPNNEGFDTLLKSDPTSISPTKVENALVLTNYGVRVLFSSSVGNLEATSRGEAHYEATLTALGSLATVIVVDAGTHSTPAAAAVFNQCSELILVTEPQPLAVKLTARLLNVVRPFGFGTSKPLTVVSLNHTRSDTIMSITQMEAVMGRSVAIGFPPALELASQAQRVGIPMAMLQPDSLTAQQYVKLSELVNTHIAKK